MLDFFVGSSIISMWLVFVGAPLTLFVLRLLAVLIHKCNWQEALMIVLLPCSLGFFHKFKEKSRIKTVYEIILSVFILLSFYGLIIVLYTHFG